MINIYSWKKSVQLTLLCIVICLCTSAVAKDAQDLRNIDSAKIARYEVLMWQDYYAKNFDGLLHNLVKMLGEQFKLATMDAFFIGSRAAYSARLFAKMPSNAKRIDYEKQVLPSIIAFYSSLQKAVAGNWDAQAVAKAELNWWINRRIPGKNSARQIGHGIANLYETLYGKSNKSIRRAGYLRAKAARLRDLQRRRGKIDWPQLQILLEQSYRELYNGINKGSVDATINKSHHSKGRPK